MGTDADAVDGLTCTHSSKQYNISNLGNEIFQQKIQPSEEDIRDEGNIAIALTLLEMISDKENKDGAFILKSLRVVGLTD